MLKKKTTTKKTVKVTDTLPDAEVKAGAKAIKDAKYNEYGTCIACQNGDPNCLHNNLVEDGQKLLCAVCGKDMKCV